MQEKQNNILSTLHQILTPFLLRRVKADVDLKIPPKKEVLVYCPMTAKQREMYEAIVNKTISDLLTKVCKIFSTKLFQVFSPRYIRSS